MILTPAAARWWSIGSALGACMCLALLVVASPWFLVPAIGLAGLAMWLATQARRTAARQEDAR